MIAPIAVGAASDECPLVHPKTRGRARPPWQALFCRLPGGEFQRPSWDDRLRFCASGDYEECPIYRGALERWCEGALVYLYLTGSSSEEGGPAPQG
jgi:hypothetical protein